MTTNPDCEVVGCEREAVNADGKCRKHRPKRDGRVDEALAAAYTLLQRADGQLGLGIHREPSMSEQWKDEARELVTLIRRWEIETRTLRALPENTEGR